jgi:hypothetical protein
MTAQFIELCGRWYLQDLYAKAKEEDYGQEQAVCIRQLAFRHNHNRKPYLAVQVDGVGITHIAFYSEADWPRWISPNMNKRQAALFQDRR